MGDVVGGERRSAVVGDEGRLVDQGVLKTDDPALAAHHFAGLLLWIPVNRAMFHGGVQHTEADLDLYATAGIRAFLAAYRAPGTP
ncbi:TetR/AcrR family transcriptional regulator C-terminal domain-containing protein [Streptomyces sp. NPDC093105]|uniref:TetR/AcrR family transcriptional regulator C-terminal domain-containing protein n=1 Tax=Streptomyces sp. NPDC093105 TaxID=3366029 RepID=UPI00381C3F6F